LIRYFYLSDDGKEWNKAFIAENMISTSFTTDFLGSASSYGIQALADSVLLIGSFSQFEKLYDLYPNIERLGRKIIESLLIMKMNRERSFLQDSAKVKYQRIFREKSRIKISHTSTPFSLTFWYYRIIFVTNHSE